MQYKFSKGLIKGLAGVIIFAVPLMIGQFPEWANLTIGGMLIMLVNFLKVKYNML